jgi:hypothetical protein
MSEYLNKLGSKAQRGSKPRCHWLTHGSKEVVAHRLTELAAPFARVTPNDRWMPNGFDSTREAQLDKADLLPEEVRIALRLWWLTAVATGQETTPTFDVASTCLVDDRPGILLVEAKAHDQELIKEAMGRKLDANSSPERKASHAPIGAAIKIACDGLSAATAKSWHISRDCNYQMSNRFAWGWKLASLGVPVVLIYLGFLRADDMEDKGVPFADDADWKLLVENHSSKLLPLEVWNERWTIDGTSFVPLVRSVEMSHAQPISDFAVQR